MLNKVKDVAERIKELRLLWDYSPEYVAKSIGIDAKDYLKYENGEDDIPISAIYEIAGFYQVDLTELLTGISPKLHDASFVKKGEGLSLERYDQYNVESLAYKYAKRKIEPLMVYLEPGDIPDAVTHNGQEFNYMLEGRMKVVVNDEEYVLSPGDSLYFNSSLPHKMYAIDGKNARFLTVILL